MEFKPFRASFETFQFGQGQGARFCKRLVMTENFERDGSGHPKVSRMTNQNSRMTKICQAFLAESAEIIPRLDFAEFYPVFNALNCTARR